MTRKLIILLSLTAIFALSGCGGNQEAEVQADPSWTGGSPLSVESQTHLAKLTTEPATFVGQTVRLQGKVTGVCKGSGCWVELTDDEGHSFIAKSVDHSITFPKDCEGKEAVVQGLIITQPSPEHDHEAHAEGGEAHECPAPLYMMELEGAKLI